MSGSVVTARVLIVLLIARYTKVHNNCTTIKYEKSLLLFSIKCICVSEMGHLQLALITSVRVIQLDLTQPFAYYTDMYGLDSTQYCFATDISYLQSPKPVVMR